MRGEKYNIKLMPATARGAWSREEGKGFPEPAFSPPPLEGTKRKAGRKENPLYVGLPTVYSKNGRAHIQGQEFAVGQPWLFRKIKSRVLAQIACGKNFIEVGERTFDKYKNCSSYVY